MLVRLLDHLKERGITAFVTNLTSGGDALERTDAGISSIMDTWILLRMIESDGERNRGLYVLKSRGMPHSNQIREMLITSKGVQLVEIYLGTQGIFTGAARAAQENRDRADAAARQQLIARRTRELDQKRELLNAQVAALKTQFAVEEEEIRASLSEEETRMKDFETARADMAAVRRSPATKMRGNDGKSESAE